MVGLVICKNEGTRVVKTFYSHYKSMGIFPDAQGQLTHKSMVGSWRIFNPFEILWLSFLPASIKKNQSKMKELEWSQDFPHYNPMIRSYPKPNAVNPPPQWCSWWNLIMIGQLVSEIFMFESVDGRTDGRRLESHTISSPWAFGSGELKMLDWYIGEISTRKWVWSCCAFIWCSICCTK